MSITEGIVVFATDEFLNVKRVYNQIYFLILIYTTELTHVYISLLANQGRLKIVLYKE